MAQPELLIVGAGPTGLAVSQAWSGRSRILEASAEVGGLCRSVEFGGGVFDIGGHSFHSPHPEVMTLVEGLMAGRWATQRRDARVWFGGGLIDYPFQDHVGQIADPAVVAQCLADRGSSAAAASADNFEGWIVRRFGDGVARHFMLPYNRKLWARDLRRMSCEWVGERVAGGAETEGARRPLQPQSQVGYPTDGGFGEIFKAMAAQAGPIAFNARVIRIDPASRMAWAADGRCWTWDQLVSTLPLPELVRVIDGCPPELVEDADALEFVSLKVLMVLVAAPLGQPPQRVYLADPDIPPHKVAFNHTSSAALRRRPAHAVICEVAYAPEKPPPADAILERETVDWLVASGLIASPADIAQTRVVDVRYGYPVYTHARPSIVARLRSWLEPRGIHTLGRFGAWDYVNSDACIWQGMTLARRLARSDQDGESRYDRI